MSDKLLMKFIRQVVKLIRRLGPMITTAECDAHIAECRIIQARNISLRRMIAIIAI